MSNKLNYDPYELLGIKKGCTEKELQQAYKKACLKWHPDKNLNNKEEAEKKFIQAKEAFQFLFDAEKRAEYDSGIERAERRDAMFKERMDKSDGERKRFINELNRREKEAAERDKGSANSVTPEMEASRKKAFAKKVKADFERLREQLEKEAEEELRKKEDMIYKARTEGITEVKKAECSKLKLKWLTEKGDYDEPKIRDTFGKFGTIMDISTILALKGGKYKMCVVEFTNDCYPIGAEGELGEFSNLKVSWIVKPEPVQVQADKDETTNKPNAPSEFTGMSYEELYSELFKEDPVEKKSRME